MQCPASPAKSVESGLPSGQESLGLGRVDSLILSIASLVNSMGSTQVAMFDLIQAINRLADSNRDLVLAMAEDGGMDEVPSSLGYLNVR